jgi:hypothetical protein
VARDFLKILLNMCALEEKKDLVWNDDIIF